MYSTPWRAAFQSQLGVNPGSSPDDQVNWDEMRGMKSAGLGDLQTFLSAFFTNGTILMLAIVAFSVLRGLVPQVYSNNTRKKEDGGTESVDLAPSPSFFGWARATLGVESDEVGRVSGVDTAQFLKFSVLARRMMLTIGLPLVAVLCPLHYFCGGSPPSERGVHSLGLHHVERGSWLFWLHAGVVWFVVIVAVEMIFESMASFLDVRFKWLLDFRPPQALTILVEHIPPDYRSDKALKDIFCRLFPGTVASAYLVKNTETLKPMVEKLKQQSLRLEILTYERDHGRKELAPKKAEELERLPQEVKELEEQVRAERTRVLREAEQLKTTPGKDRRRSQAVSVHDTMKTVATGSGFVTFKSQREALMALHTRCSADEDEFRMSIPPQPSDIIYEDLQAPKFRRKLWEFLGTSCIFLLFWFFLPLVMLISGFTKLEALEAHSDTLRDFIDNHPGLHAQIDGVLSTLALVLMMSFLPTLLMLIFGQFYSLKANGWAQLKLQRYYFAFLVAFVLLATAIGSSLLARAISIYRRPKTIFIALAEALPSATNFYANYLLVQCMQSGIELTRYVQFAKYFSFKAILGERRAIELTEPEDQDYYGIGARSARMALDLCIGLVFCSLAPPLALVAAADFFMGRLAYGYLMVFAETPKVDLGGPHFVQQLWHTQFGLLLYVVLMSSVLFRRADHWGPAAIAASAIPYVAYSMWRFDHGFLWDNLPMLDICDEAAMKQVEGKMEEYRAHTDGVTPYMQPELLEDGVDASSGRPVSWTTPREA
mmetsp:Transcript_135474/g.420884  ORF Transcript_135474/g.420884 Transcript_135474/m.420884 type:complete len:770 (+) Transcript_135474:42-2351(+)